MKEDRLLKEFGERIKDLRERRKMTQDELALKSGYADRSSIAKIELGLRDIPQNKILAIANALGVKPAYLMGWEDEQGNPIDRESELQKRVTSVLLKLSEDDLMDVLEYAEYRLERKNKM